MEVSDMQPLRKVINDAPEMIAIPEELRHKRIEMILWPLEEDSEIETLSSVGRGWSFRTMNVQDVIMPARDERYER
jgi:hypothetical protein